VCEGYTLVSLFAEKVRTEVLHVKKIAYCVHTVFSLRSEPYSLAYHSLVSVRQKNNKAALSHPLGLTTAHELVEDALSVVGEVSELCFPADESVWVAL